MTNKNIKINTSVSVCEENGRTKVHPKASQFWLFYSNLSSGRQQCCCFILKCSMESLDRIYFAVNVQGFPGCQHHEPHVCTHRSFSWPQPSNLNFHRCLSLAIFQLTPRELRQGALLLIQTKINFILLCCVHYGKPSCSQLSNTTAGSKHTHVDIDILSIYL